MELSPCTLLSAPSVAMFCEKFHVTVSHNRIGHADNDLGKITAKGNPQSVLAKDHVVTARGVDLVRFVCFPSE